MWKTHLSATWCPWRLKMNWNRTRGHSTSLVIRLYWRRIRWINVDLWFRTGMDTEISWFFVRSYEHLNRRVVGIAVSYVCTAEYCTHIILVIPLVHQRRCLKEICLLFQWKLLRLLSKKPLIFTWNHHTIRFNNIKSQTFRLFKIYFEFLLLIIQSLE